MLSHRIVSTMTDTIAYIIAIFLLSAALTSHAANTKQLKIIDLLNKPSEFDQQFVTVEGEILSKHLIPQIRGGRPLFTFELSDGTGSITVTSTIGMMMNEGDRIRVYGRFRNFRTVGSETVLANELDTSDGEIEVLYSKMEEMMKTSDPNLLGVPVLPIETVWSFSVSIASIASAVFAAIAAASIILRRRRFNLGLAIEVIHVDVLPTHDTNSTSIKIRIRGISTKIIPPKLSKDIGLIIGKQLYIPHDVRLFPKMEEPIFPISVENDVFLDFTFYIPQSMLNKKNCKVDLVLTDAFCNKRFRVRISGNIKGLSAFNANQETNHNIDESH